MNRKFFPIIFTIPLCFGCSLARSIDSSKAAASVERPLSERELPQTLTFFKAADEELAAKSMDPFDVPSGPVHPTSTTEGMRISVRVRQKTVNKEEKTKSDTPKAKGRADLGKTPKPIVEPPKIDEYEEDPFEGVTAWPIGEFPSESERKRV